MSQWQRLCGTILVLTLTLLVFSCGGGLNGRLDSAPAGESGPIGTPDEFAPQGPQATDFFPGLPAVPAGDSDVPGTHLVSVITDNIQMGYEYSSRSLTGATVNLEALELVTGGGVDVAFGLWQWTGLVGGLKPEELSLDFDALGGDEFWLLLSNYNTGLWEIQGPLDGTQSIFPFTPGTLYISPNGCTYVALITCQGNQMTVNSLNLTVDADVDGPTKPQNLHTTNVSSNQIRLAWDAVSGASGYNTYMLEGGRDYDFFQMDPGVQKLNTNPRTNPVFTINNLTQGTLYRFRVEAVDDAGNTSPLSDRLDVTTVADLPPDAPTDLHTTNIGGTSATLAWTAPAGPVPANTYNMYYHPTNANFSAPGDAGVIKANSSPIDGSGTLSFQATGLDLLTQYHFKVSGVSLSGQEGPLSEVCTFSTVSNQPPQPEFFWTPSDYIGVDQLVLFNPATSSDDTTPLVDCLASWDFDNDGTFELTNQPGNEIQSFSYATPGVKTVLFRLADDSGDFGEVTHDIYVSRKIDTSDFGSGIGFPGVVLGADTDAANSRIATLVDAGPNLLLYYYNGSTWSQIDATNQIGSDTVHDIAMGAGGAIGILHSTAPDWSISVYNSSWSSVGGGTVSGAVAFGYGALEFAPGNGRYTAALMYPIPAGVEDNIWDMTVFHQTSGSSNNVQLLNNLLTFNVFDVVRNDTTTYCVYGGNEGSTQVKVANIPDSGSGSNSVMQTVSSRIDEVRVQADPGNSSQVFWTGRNGTTIFWGDNYGAANGGSQTLNTGHAAITGLLGMKFASDNQCEFYWSDQDSARNDFLRRYVTSPAGLTELASAYGLSDSGFGSFYSDGNGDGVYFVCTEDRDGTARGYMYVGASEARKEIVHDLQSQDDFGPASVPLVSADDSVTVLFNYTNPGVMRADATSALAAFSTQAAGEDAYLAPTAACLTSDADKFMTASYTDEGELLLSQFAKSDSTVTQTLAVNGSSRCRLAYNPGSSIAMAVYAEASDMNIAARYWNGAVWSSPVTVYSGGSPILHLGLAAKSGTEFGVAFYDQSFNLRFAESSGSGASWNAPTSLSTEALNIYAGVGISYNGSGDCAIAVERDNGAGNRGIWVGIVPDGGSVAWEKALDTFGSVGLGIYSFYSGASPIVLFYETVGGEMSLSAKVRMLEKGASWTNVALPVSLHGKFFGAAMDSSGNIVLSGINYVPSPHPAMVCVLEAP